jgi:hypothetical protein
MKSNMNVMNLLRIRTIPLFLIPLMANAYAATPLLDGETEVTGQGLIEAQSLPMVLVEDVVLCGTKSMRVTVEALKPDKQDLNLDFKMHAVPVTDWRGYETLVLDLYNDSENATVLKLEVHTLADDARQSIALPARRWAHLRVPIATMNPQHTDMAHVTEIAFGLIRADAPLTVYLDNLTLLKAGETPPALSPAFIAQRIEALQQDVKESKAAFASLDLQRDSAAAGAAAIVRNNLAAIETAITGASMDAEDYLEVCAGLDAEMRDLKRVDSIAAFADACTRAGNTENQAVLVGVATSMEKLFPRAMPVTLRPPTTIDVSLGRNETESVQIGVLPLREALRNVSVQIGVLRSDTGALLPDKAVACDVVGFVETKIQPPYGSPLVGWWPDPLLDFTGPADIVRGDLQSFWIRVRAPKGQAPGVYKGELTVDGRGMNSVRIPLTVTVRNFVLPDVSPLPEAISFGSPIRPYSMLLEDLIATPQWDTTLKYRWADFLADYYISYDHLYRRSPPDFEVLDYLNAQGRLGTFNLGYCGIGKTKDGHARPEDLKDMLAWAGEGYRKARERGWLNHAYIYGFDEVHPEWFQCVEETAAAIKEAMPGVLMLTTAYDYSFGKEGHMPSVDGWTPKTKEFEPELVADTRARGKQVWWYICVSPHNPYANIFLEYAAIESRLLMGAMTARYRPDGFLYYQISLWQPTEPIKSGPYTNWTARSYKDYHGDGSWVCMREGGLPVPTIRLENYRDGLEDYAYVRLLEEAVQIREDQGTALSPQESAWLAKAKATLEVPGDLVVSLTEYSRDPARLYAWREEIAALIENAKLSDLNPWKEPFSLRAPSGKKE